MDIENTYPVLQKILRHRFGVDIPASHYSYQFGTYQEAMLYSCLYLPLELSKRGEEIIGYVLKPKNYHFNILESLHCNTLGEETELLLEYMLTMWRGWCSLMHQGQNIEIRKIPEEKQSIQSKGLEILIGKEQSQIPSIILEKTPFESTAILNNIQKRLLQENRDIKSYFRSPDSVNKALMYAPLFCPPLKKVDGSLLIDVFQDDALEIKFRKALSSGQSRATLESSFNRKEVDMVLVPQDEEDEDLDAMAYRLRDAWAASLAARVPNRYLTVAILDPQEEGGALGVDVYQRELRAHE